MFICGNENEIIIYKYPIWILQLIMSEKLNPQYKLILDEALYTYKMYDSHYIFQIIVYCELLFR